MLVMLQALFNTSGRVASDRSLGETVLADTSQLTDTVHYELSTATTRADSQCPREAGQDTPTETVLRSRAKGVPGSGFGVRGSASGYEKGDGGAEVGFGRIPELDHERMPIESCLNDPSLHPLASAVHDTDLAKARVVRRVDILLDHGLHVSGGKGVEIKRAVDRNPVKHAPARKRCRE